jgi:hypothetical protein
MDTTHHGPPLAWVSVKFRPGFTTGHFDIAIWEGGYQQRSRLVLEVEDTALPLSIDLAGELDVALSEAAEAALRHLTGLDSTRMV